MQLLVSLQHDRDGWYELSRHLHGRRRHPGGRRDGHGHGARYFDRHAGLQPDVRRSPRPRQSTRRPRALGREHARRSRRRTWPGADPGTIIDTWYRCDAPAQNCGYGHCNASQLHRVASGRRTHDRGHGDGRILGTATAPVSSLPTTIVTYAPPASDPSNPPTISGSAQQGQTLTASPGNWSNSPTSYATSGRIATAPDMAARPSLGRPVRRTRRPPATWETRSSSASTASTTAERDPPSRPRRTGLVRTTSAMSLTAAPSAPVTNQDGPLAATVSSAAAAAAPSGSVAFLDHGKAISGCGAVPVPPVRTERDRVLPGLVRRRVGAADGDVHARRRLGRARVDQPRPDAHHRQGRDEDRP